MRVYVGMSGGVDSSLTAALLKEQGHTVTGVYMKNWTQDLPGMRCPWADDLADAKRVAVQLGIDFKVFDFENEYKHKVVDYMIQEYELGRTPNPDIMCNQEVKFKLFLEAALEDGAEMIATGHYARVVHGEVKGDSASAKAANSSEWLHAGPDKGPGALSDSGSRYSEEPAALADGLDAFVHEHLQPKSDRAPGPLLAPGAKPFMEGGIQAVHSALLKQAADTNKDQTYFLYRITGKALAKTLFPLGTFTKPQVREMAKERGLFTAGKKDSQGICFVGKVGIKEFLSEYVTQTPGPIIDKKTGKTLGHHDGAIFYTLGQRHGLDVGGGLPYYVVGKDMAKNEVYVTTDLNDETLWRRTVRLESLHWINQPPNDGVYQIRIRHRAPLVEAALCLTGAVAELTLADPQRAIAAGQSIVVYSSDTCLGGGIVSV